MKWIDIRNKPAPAGGHYDTWILVKNSAGYHAAVNELVEDGSGNVYGYVMTPEDEKKVISGITYWAWINKNG